MDMIKNKIKSLLPFKSRLLLSYVKNINHNPYSLRALQSQKSNVSDFFVFDKDCHRLTFVAENVRALLLGEKVDVKHNFIFFSEKGNVLQKRIFYSNEFFTKINLVKNNNFDKYSSFIHFVESDHNLEDFLIKNQTKTVLKLYEQNRGYSIFYPNLNSSGAIVHGNFGGITKDLKKTAKRTFLSHIYTPIYKFSKFSRYDLVFNNPTSKKLAIKITHNNSMKICDIEINSMGTKYFRVENYTGSLSFQSKLPMCRPLIIKNPTPNNCGNFDVFHS